MFDPESFRLDVERELLARSVALGLLEPWPGPPVPVHNAEHAIRAAANDMPWRASAVRVQRRLDLHVPLAVYVGDVPSTVVQDGEEALVVKVPFELELALPPPQARALLGWHVGTHLAHVIHPTYAAGWAAARHASARTVPYAFGIAARMTADRIALFASEDMPATLAHIAGALESPDFDANAWLRACQRHVDQLLVDPDADLAEAELALRSCAVGLEMDRADELARCAMLPRCSGV